jgi:hypothetical protein
MLSSGKRITSTQLKPNLYGKPRKTLGQKAKHLQITKLFDLAEERSDDKRNLDWSIGNEYQSVRSMNRGRKRGEEKEHGGGTLATFLSSCWMEMLRYGRCSGENIIVQYTKLLTACVYTSR